MQVIIKAPLLFLLLELSIQPFSDGVIPIESGVQKYTATCMKTTLLDLLIPREALKNNPYWWRMLLCEVYILI